MAHTIDELLDVVQKKDTLDASLIELVNGMNAKLTEVLQGVQIPADVQQKIDAIFDDVTANSQKVSDALAANASTDTSSEPSTSTETSTETSATDTSSTNAPTVTEGTATATEGTVTS